MRNLEANKELIFCSVSEQPVALATPYNLSGFANTFVNSKFFVNANITLSDDVGGEM